MAVPEAFLQALAKRLGVLPSAYTAFANFINAWQPYEGGDAVDRNNPLNTMQGAQGATNINSVGVKAYPDLQTGVEATAQTLENGNYPQLLQALKQGNFPNMTQITPEIRKWGTNGFADALDGGQTPAPDTGTPPPVNINDAVATLDTGKGQGDVGKWTEILNGLVAQQPDPSDPRFGPNGEDDYQSAQAAWTNAVSGVTTAIKTLQAIQPDPNQGAQNAIDAFNSATSRASAETGAENAISNREDTITSADNAQTSRATADINRFLGGLGESRQRADLQQSAKQAAQPWATSSGKGGFTGADLGALFTNYPGLNNAAGDTLLQYPTVLDYNPTKDMNWWDKQFGVTGSIPEVPSLAPRSIPSLVGTQPSFSGPSLAPAASNEWWK